MCKCCDKMVLWIYFKLQRSLRWEWLVGLDFDWKILTGQKDFRWPAVVSGSARVKIYSFNVLSKVYIACRVVTLVAVIMQMVYLNMTVEFNCQVCLATEVPESSVVLIAISYLGFRKRTPGKSVSRPDCVKALTYSYNI